VIEDKARKIALEEVGKYK